MGVGVKKERHPAPPGSQRQSSAVRHKYQTGTPAEPPEGTTLKQREQPIKSRLKCSFARSIIPVFGLRHLQLTSFVWGKNK